jgi:hypothetical protein
MIRMKLHGSFLCSILALVCAASFGAATGDTLLVPNSIQKIWDQGPYNAFTDLVFWHGQFYCVFRQGSAHRSTDGSLRVICSADGKTWSSVAELKYPDADMRDAHFSILPDDRLLLSSAVRTSDGAFRSIASFSRDGREWNQPKTILPHDRWLWRLAWHDGVGYGFAYLTSSSKRGMELYSTVNGLDYTKIDNNATPDGYVNEHAITFRPDGTAICLVRRDAVKGVGRPTAQIGIAAPPYSTWQWTDAGIFAGCPALAELPDGRIIAGVRLIDGKPRTALCWLDAENGKLIPALAIPPFGNTTPGDVGYPGLIYRDGVLFVSFYAKSDGKCCIFFAEISVPPTAATKPADARH